MSELAASDALSDLAHVNPSTALPSAGVVSYIGMEDVSENYELLRTHDRTVRHSGSYTKFKEGDLLFAKITPCMENGKGAVAHNLANGAGFGSTEFHVLRATSGDPGFLAQWLQSRELRRAAEAQMTGSAGQRRVPSNFFSSFRIPSLPLPEQRRIAEILDTLDCQIRATEQLIAKLKIAKLGLLNDLLTCGLDDDGRLRSPVIAEDKFVETELGLRPYCWIVEPLGSLLSRSEYGISTALSDTGALPVLRMHNISDGEIVVNDLKYSDSTGAHNLLLAPGDVLFNRTNSFEHVGRTGIWRGQTTRASFASYLVRLVPGPRITNEFLNLLLNFKRTQIDMRQWATPGVHQVNINPTNLKRVAVAIPSSLNEQNRICDVVHAHDQLCIREARTLEKLRAQKQGLLSDLLTGRVRVSVEAAP